MRFGTSSSRELSRGRKTWSWCVRVRRQLSEAAWSPAVTTTTEMTQGNRNSTAACGSAATCGGRGNISQWRHREVGRVNVTCESSFNCDIPKRDVPSVNVHHLSTETSRNGSCQVSMRIIFQRRHLEVGRVKRQYTTSFNGDISKWDVSNVNAQHPPMVTSRSGTCQASHP